PPRALCRSCRRGPVAPPRAWPILRRAVTRGGSTPDVGPARQNLLDVTGRDKRDVAPHRALERADGRADVHRLLELALLEHGPEESGDVGIAGADRIDHLDRRHVSRTVEALGG